MGARLYNIKLVVFDFDGVFTDNLVFVNQKGEETVACFRGDGIGLSRLKNAGVKTLVISSEPNPVVEQRCKKMEIDCVSGCKDKLAVLKDIASKSNVVLKDICFVGNDINDLDCLTNVGLSVAVSDACPEVLKVVHMVTKHKGGHGAVREVCDLLYIAKKEKGEGVCNG
jgi:3-deoxy-D-manno-octulosonate 8-phosphate phosphatase (KDO 8-P phosphatase)